MIPTENKIWNELTSWDYISKLVKIRRLLKSLMLNKIKVCSEKDDDQSYQFRKQEEYITI